MHEQCSWVVFHACMHVGQDKLEPHQDSKRAGEQLDKMNIVHVMACTFLQSILLKHS